MPYAIDLDRLIVGALLHDVGKLMETERDGKGGYRKSRAGQLARHPISGAILAAQCGMPDDVVNTIACHAKEGDGASKVIETVLIHQADFATFDPLVMMSKGQIVLLDPARPGANYPEKIISRSCGRDVKPGEIADVEIDNARSPVH